MSEPDNAQFEITLKDVTLSYPHVFEPQVFEGDKGKPAFGVQIILHKTKDAGQIKNIRAKMEQVRVAKPLNGALVPEDKLCLRDGTNRVKADGSFPEGYSADVMYLSARNYKRPAVVDRDRSVLAASDDKIYGGVKANVVVRFWGQSHKLYGKRINCSLEAIQRVGDGERYGAAPVDPNSKFADLSGVDDDDPSQ